MFELQKMLFEEKITRAKMLNYSPKSENKLSIYVYRNHSFELIERILNPYLDYAGLSANFIYSDYDDSLSFVNLKTDVNLIILWVDLGRYDIIDKEEFVHNRMIELSRMYDGKILFIPCRGSIKENININNLTVMLLDDIKDSLSGEFLDYRMEKHTGTILSAKACALIAKEIGLLYIPYVLNKRIKCIAIDLDNTLYKGILGEDGYEKLELTEGHKKLHEYIKKLADTGIILAIVSKNNDSDVHNMFKRRKDFPLKESDFTKIYANWNPKSENIELLAKYLNIGTDSLLFIDDNAGEILEVYSTHANINYILASDDADITLDCLEHYPGTLRIGVEVEDTLRKGDIIANESRKKIFDSTSLEDYLRQLCVTITYDVNNISHLKRVTELSNKTNQFIFGYLRYSNNEIYKRILSDSYDVISISMSDKLCDSGIIGVCVIKREKDYLYLEECFVSCRALGRGVEKIIVLGAIKIICDKLHINNLKVNFIRGERNVPAANFVNLYLSDNVDKVSSFSYEFPKALLDMCIINM